ncbi:MAG: mobile mystery protein A [Actinobacteria bacterium]|nr:mobile mystery protein A [Actinomycetota bacterium]
MSRFRPLVTLMPPDGWIRSIRESLQMSQAQLAVRLGVSQRTVHAMEISEVEGRIQVESLKRAADALNCDLAYALIPRRSLEETIRSRARSLAKEQMVAINQTMLLEDQRPKGNVSAIEELTEYILSHNVPLWKGPAKSGK